MKRAVAALRRANSNFLGVVLNMVDMKAGYYYYYYYYYDHDNPKEPPADLSLRDKSPRPRIASGKR